MEELQDAIEDAQYINAISSQDEGPRPVIAWEVPTDEALEEWKTTIRKKDEEHAFTLEWCLSSPIGFFLFSAFLKDTCKDYFRINFVEEVTRWRIVKGKHRSEMARHILNDYLTKTIETDPATGETLPRKTEIEEYDLERPYLGSAYTQEQIKTLFDDNFDPSCASNCIGLCGTVLEEILSSARSIGWKEDSLLNGSSDVSAENGTVENKDPEEGKKKEQSTPVRGRLIHSTLPAGTSRADSLDTSKHSTRMLLSTLPGNIFDVGEGIILESLRRDYWEAFLGSEEQKRLYNFLWFRDRKVVAEDFFVMRVLGRGGFGLVTACKKGTSGKLYAMKVMNKRRMKMKKSTQLALSERDCLAAVDSPFVVNLKYSFQSKDDVFLILDLMTGGDLNFHLSQKVRFPKKESVYYAACIMLGLQALHDKGYVYRDLKPENCLLAEDGRVKISDLGLATKITPTLHGAAGTRGYWAPEMLRRDKNGKRMSYGHTVDWFSYGCVLAEFISGRNPFRSEDALKFGQSEGGHSTKEKAIDYATLHMEPNFDPKYFEPEAASICRSLLDKNEKSRLGSRGCRDIMKHPWFREVNWEMIITDRKKPPFIPRKDVNAMSQSEIGTFAESKEFQDTVMGEKDEQVYKDWNWTNHRAYAAEVIEYMIYERETGRPLVPLSQAGPCCCAIL